MSKDNSIFILWLKSNGFKQQKNKDENKMLSCSIFVNISFMDATSALQPGCIASHGLGKFANLTLFKMQFSLCNT